MSRRRLRRRVARAGAGRAAASRWAWLGRLWRLSTGRFGLIVVAVVLATAVVASFWTPFDPQQVDDLATGGRRRAGRT